MPELSSVRERLFYVALALQVGAVVCVGVAYAKRNDVAIEGAYFNRSSGKAVAVGVWPGGAPTPWLIAAAALLIAAAAVFVLDHRSRNR